jgi:small subunit ribosomal protein S6
MNFYEVVFIVKHDASASHIESVTQDIASVINEAGGSVMKTEFCGLRTLAYQIKKSKKGHYILLSVSCPPDAVIELERRLRINEDIIRSLIVKVDKPDSNPSALMRKSAHDAQS